jgi:hypothetical protein
LQEQFPIAQKQWDTIAPFRSQITHKATLSLRETGHSAEDICATLLTLHLIDSKPLSETLSVLTAQRSRSLKQALTRNLEPAPPVKDIKTGSTDKSRRKVQAHSVRIAINGVLDIISSTLGSARSVFSDQPDASSGFMHHTLNFIEAGGGSSEGSPLPESLQISTGRLLSKMSSSAPVLLPPAIKSYKPYLDLASSSATVASEELRGRLDEWFSTNLEQLSTTLHTWVASLNSAKQVWLLLSWFRSYVQTSMQLENDEQARLLSTMEGACQKHIVHIWTTALRDMREVFETRLHTALSKMKPENTPSGQFNESKTWPSLTGSQMPHKRVMPTFFESSLTWSPLA